MAILTTEKFALFDTETIWLFGGRNGYVQYHIDDVKEALGKKFDPTAEYKLATHARVSLIRGQGFTEVGKLPDFTENESGTMLIMERKAPVERPIDNILGATDASSGTP